MKKYLLPREGVFYKANLHTHTTISDGSLSAEDTKMKYLEKGYSIVAFTDHEVMVPHPELTDENFLAITSVEILVNDKTCDCQSCKKTYHLNIYSPNENQSCFDTFNKNVIWKKHSYDYITPEQAKINYVRNYSIESINEIVKIANEQNCLVSYNHPVWSLQDYNDYIDLEGIWGVEWYNNTCARMGYYDSMKPIDDLLRQGKKVFPLATDDAHSIDDLYGGFVMVKASNLKYDTIFSALKKGDFYSSTGPEIFDLIFEEGNIYIKTSPVKKIVLTTDRRMTYYVESKELIEANFDINSFLREYYTNNNINQYFRITIIDEYGNRAHTRAYFLDELL